MRMEKRALHDKQERELAKIFLQYGREAFNPYKDLLDHFNAGRKKDDCFPLPPLYFRRAGEDVMQAWAAPWEALRRKIGKAAGRKVKGRKKSSPEGAEYIDAIAAAWWCLAAERTERHCNRCVQPTEKGRAPFVATDDGTAPNLPGV